MPGFDYSNYPIHIPAEPPKTARRKVPIWNVQPGTSQVFVPLQPHIIKFGTHWIKEQKRSIFCGGPNGDCLMDHTKQDFRWCGYLLVFLRRWAGQLHGKYQELRGVRLLHITPGACKSCPALDDPSTDLLQKKVIAWRDGETKRAEVMMELAPLDVREYEPSTFDTFAYIRDMMSAPNNELKRALTGGKPQ